MITSTRRLAAQLRPVLRRAQTNRRGLRPAVGFIGGKEGLIVKADCDDAVVEYRMPGTFHEETFRSICDRRNRPCRRLAG